MVGMKAFQIPLILASLILSYGCETTTPDDSSEEVEKTSGRCEDIEKALRNLLDEGLVAHYPFDGNGSDVTGNGHDGIVSGASSSPDRHGNAGKAYHFGPGQLFETNSTFVGMPSYTISFWVKNLKPLEKKNGSRFVHFANTAIGLDYGDMEHGLPTRPMDALRVYFNKIRDAEVPSSENQMTRYIYPAPGGFQKWTLVTWAIDSDDDTSLYFDDKLIQKASVSIDKTHGVALNSTKLGNTELYQNFERWIDDVRIYDRALSSAEVSALYQLERVRGERDLNAISPKGKKTNLTNEKEPNTWERRFGGADGDGLSDVASTSDGGFLLVGSSRSDVGGEKSENAKGEDDFWAIRIDADGNKLWDKTYGGSKSEVCYGLAESSDGGFLLVGHSYSGAKDGDKTEPSRGGVDMWAVRIDADGKKLWDKTLGGSASGDVCRSALQTTDGGFLLAGYSSSGASGDKSEGNLGLFDYWAVKIDSEGNKQWDKRYGGNSADVCSEVIATLDGGFLLLGHSRSDKGGDKSEPRRSGPREPDFWVVRIDGEGKKLWDRTFGGNSHDYCRNAIALKDGSFLLLGDSQSGVGGDRSEPNRGLSDMWVIKIDSNGEKVWDKAYGGDRYEYCSSVVALQDGSFLLAGPSDSLSGGEHSQPSRGGWDYWILKVDGKGDKIWDRRYGGEGNDGEAKIVRAKDGGFLLAGNSSSDASGDLSENSRGKEDFWAVKIDEQGIFSTARSSAKQTHPASIPKEASNDESNVPDSVKQGLLAHYPFDGDAKDVSGNGHHGKVNSAELAADRFGNEDKAYRLTTWWREGNLPKDWGISLGDFDQLDSPESFSFSLWFKREINHGGGHTNTAFSVNNVLISQASYDMGWQEGKKISNLEIGSEGGILEIYVDAGDSPADGTVMVNAGVTSGRWHHIALTYGNGLSVYFDGKHLKTWDHYKGKLQNSGTLPLTLGASGQNKKYWGGFDGLIDELRIYERALSASEVQSLYGIGGKSSSPLRAIPLLPSPNAPSKPKIFDPFK
jgi:uncharacterized membrane protein